jgi:hypothetical protein
MGFQFDRIHNRTADTAKVQFVFHQTAITGGAVGVQNNPGNLSAMKSGFPPFSGIAAALRSFD